MVTLSEIEMLAALLARAGVNAYEAAWANNLMDRLRAQAQKLPTAKTDGRVGSEGQDLPDRAHDKD